MSTHLVARVARCGRMALQCDTVFTYSGRMAPFETPLEREIVTRMYRHARAERVSQAQLAEAAGITREAMSSYINGHRPIPFRVLLAACDRLNLPFEQLVAEAEGRG